MFAKFSLGQVVHHRDQDYRGVILDVDPMFLCGGEAAGQLAGEGEPLDRPWYHVLINGREHVTYVSESSLSVDDSGEPVNHRSLALYFTDFDGEHYTPRRLVN